MKVVGFQHEILHVTVAVSSPFNNLDAVFDPLNHGGRDRKIKVVEDADGMPSQFPGESG